MAKRDPSAETFAALRRLEADPRASDAESVLRRALSSKSAVFVERAAPIVANGGWLSLVPDLESAFERFRDNSGADQFSAAKIAVVRALARLGSGIEVLLQAIDHVQYQYGGDEDEVVDGGAELRATAIILLAETDYPMRREEAVRKLKDPGDAVRVAAIKALIVEPRDGTSLLLRYVALNGEKPMVLLECFRALIVTDRFGLEFVLDFCRIDNVAVELVVAIALSESGREEALESVIGLWKLRRELAKHSRETREISLTLLLAIVTFRSDAGLEFLYQVVRDGDVLYTQQTIDALEMYRDDPVVGAKLLEAAEDNGDPAIIEVVKQRFRTKPAPRSEAP